MSNKQQTAVEKFIKKLRELGYLGIDYSPELLKAIEQAKEMEKEQHGVTFHVGVQWIQYQMDSIHGCLEYWDKEPPEFETFYNETYGGNNGRSS